MIKVSYNFDHPFAGQDMSGTMEFPDGTTDTEIEAEVREEFFNHFNFGWSRVEPGDEEEE